MAAAFVQGTGVQSVGSVASLSKAFDSDITAGNLIVIAGISSSNRLPSNACADTQINTYARDANVSATVASTQASLWSAPNAAGGACTVTITPSPSDFLAIGISEFSGMVTASPLDAQNTGSATPLDTTLVTGDVVTDQNTGMVAVVSHGGSTVGITEDGSYSLIFEDTNSSSMPINWDYKIVAAGTYTGSWTFSGGVQNRVGAAAAYKEAAAGASGIAHLVTTGGWVF